MSPFQIVLYIFAFIAYFSINSTTELKKYSDDVIEFWDAVEPTKPIATKVEVTTPSQRRSLFSLFKFRENTNKDNGTSIKPWRYYLPCKLRLIIRIIWFCFARFCFRLVASSEEFLSQTASNITKVLKEMKYAKFSVW